MIKTLSLLPMLAVAFLANAQVAFQKYYQDIGGASSVPPYSTTELDRGASILKSNTGGYIVATTTVFQGLEVIKVCEFDDSGVPIWNEIYPQFSGQTSPSQQRVFKINYNVDRTGYILTGHADDLNGMRTIIMEIDNMGNVVWSKYYGEPNGVGLDIIPTADGGGYVQVGYTSNDHNEISSYRASVIRKINASGTVIWQKVADDLPSMSWNNHADYDFAENVLEIEFGRNIYYFVSGSVTYEKSSSDRLEGVLALLLDANGNLVWDGSFYAPYTHITGVDAVYSAEYGGIFLSINEATHNAVSVIDFGRLALLDINTGVVNGYWGIEITGSPGTEFAHLGFQNKIFMDQGNLRIFGYVTDYHYNDGSTVIDKNDLYCPMEINIDPATMSLNYHRIYYNNSWNYDQGVQGFLGTLTGEAPRVHTPDMTVIRGVPTNQVDFTMIGYHQNMHSMSLFGGNTGDAAFCRELYMNSYLFDITSPTNNKNQFGTFTSQSPDNASVQTQNRTLTPNDCDQFVIPISGPMSVGEVQTSELEVTTVRDQMVLTWNGTSGSGSAPYRVTLFDVNGREVYNEKLTLGQESLRISPVALRSGAGIYLLKAEHLGTGEFHNQKVVLSR